MRGENVGTPAVQQRRRRPPSVRPAAVGVFQCLVVSADPDRRAELAWAASDQGWSTVVCADARNALAASKRTVLGLALLDLESPHGRTPSGFREVTEQLTSDSGTMVVVCGHDGDAKEEIWARQMGVWLYLPGLEQSSNISTVCREAILLARRMTSPDGSRR